MVLLLLRLILSEKSKAVRHGCDSFSSSTFVVVIVVLLNFRWFEMRHFSTVGGRTAKIQFLSRNCGEHQLGIRPNIGPF
jgi:hypothetical protein